MTARRPVLAWFPSGSCSAATARPAAGAARPAAAAARPARPVAAERRRRP